MPGRVSVRLQEDGLAGELGRMDMEEGGTALESPSVHTVRACSGKSNARAWALAAVALTLLRGDSNLYRALTILGTLL